MQAIADNVALPQMQHAVKANFYCASEFELLCIPVFTLPLWVGRGGRDYFGSFLLLTRIKSKRRRFGERSESPDRIKPKADFPRATDASKHRHWCGLPSAAKEEVRAASSLCV